ELRRPARPRSLRAPREARCAGGERCTTPRRECSRWPRAHGPFFARGARHRSLTARWLQAVVLTWRDEEDRRMTIDFTGRDVVVTGATGEMGEAVTRLLLESG